MNIEKRSIGPIAIRTRQEPGGMAPYVVNPQNRPDYAGNGSGMRNLFRILCAHKRTHPDKPIPKTFMELGKLSGLTKQGAQMGYKRLTDKGYDLPQLAGQKEKADRMAENKRVKELVEKGAGFIEIANRERMEPQKLQQVLNRFSNVDRASIPSYKQEQLLRREVMVAEVAHLKFKGEPDEEIQKIMGLGKPLLGDILRRVHSQVEAPRIKYEKRPIRSKKRSKEELSVFYTQVRGLRDEGLSYSQIAKRLGVRKHFVRNAVHNLLERGEIERKVKK